MTFDELLKEIGRIPCQEVRAEEAEYCERVVAKEQLSALTVSLQAYFGVALKPAGASASAEALKNAEPYGGVQVNQTMYYKEAGAFRDLALLWPWGNGQSTTLKIIRTAAVSV